MPVIDGSQTPRARQDAALHALAARFAPLIHFDRNEPFLPLAAGYTILRADGDSPSFERRIELKGPDRPPAVLAIEYAIWWDWDIQHLYELEHTWSYVGANGDVVFVEASWHGGYAAAVLDDGRVPLQDGHPVLYSQPGKHAFVPLAEPLLEIRRETAQTCGKKAGSDGLLVKEMFREGIGALKTPENDALINTYLKAHAFRPACRWDKDVLITHDMLVPWDDLRDWIPARVAWVLGTLPVT
jgi:putative hydrolase of the HAD superfamily